jgi:VWFA-related protein
VAGVVAFRLQWNLGMRVAVLCLLSTCVAWPQFRSTVPLVVAPATVKDGKGRIVDGLEPSDLILYDNNVLRPIQADIAVYPISLVVAVESSQSSKAILDKLGNSGILFSQLLAADLGETALLSFSDEVTPLVDFTSDPDDLTHELKRLRPDGAGAAVLDGLRKALDMLAHRPPGRRLIVLMISENRDRSSQVKLPDVVQQVQHLNAAVFWLTYSTTLSQYTDRRVTTIGAVEDPKEKGKDRKKDETVLPADTPPMDLLAPFTALAHLTKPNVANLFTRLTGSEESSFLTKGALESAIHDIGEEIHRQYILTFPPAAGEPGLFHAIRVEVRNRPDLKVTTREGYWSIQ